MLEKKIKLLLEELDSHTISLKSSSRIMDSCLDIMNDIRGIEGYKDFRDFNLRLSMNNFSYMLEDEEEIEKRYWDNSIAELKYDLTGFLRRLQK